MHAGTGRQEDRDTVEARLNTYRGVFSSLLAKVHSDLVGRVRDNEAASKEVEEAIRASLQDTRDRDALAAWLGSVVGRGPTGERRPADAVAEALRAVCDADTDEAAKRAAASQLFEHLAGVALMPVNAATREFFYAGIFHRIVDSDYHRAIMDSVSVPITRGSVGHTFLSNAPLRLVPDSLKELRGTVAIEDVIGGNLSIAMCNLRTDAPGPPADPPRYGVLFYFLPLPGFFGHLGEGVTTKLLEAVGQAHESGLLYSLRWAESQEERDRITQLLRGPDAPDPGAAAEASVPSYADVLRAIMPEQPEYDPLGAVAAVAFRDDTRSVTPLAVRGSRRFLERSLFHEALRSPSFHSVLERAVAAGGGSGPSEPCLPPLVRVEPHGEPAGAPASPDDPLSLWPSLVIAPDQDSGEGLAGIFVAHFTTGAVREGGVPSLADARKERETVFAPLRWLGAVYEHEWLECLSRVRGLPVDAEAPTGARDALDRSVANLKLIADSSDSYVNLLAVTLARGYDETRLTGYLAALFSLLGARLAGALGSVPPLLQNAREVVEAVRALREAILGTARARGSLLLGISGYRIGRDRAFISVVEPVERDHAGIGRLADAGEHARVGRLVSLLRLWDGVGEGSPPASVRLFQAAETPVDDQAAGGETAGGNGAAFLLSGLGGEGHTNGSDDAALLERLALRCCEPSSCSEDGTWSQETELVDTVEGGVCARIRWAGGLLTIPVGLALDDAGLQHALADAVRLNERQAHGRGTREGLSAEAARLMLLEGDLPLARAFRRLYPFDDSASIHGFMVPTSRDDQREHFVFGCHPESRRSRVDLVDALENARRSLHAVNAAIRADLGVGVMHQLGEIAHSIESNTQLLHYNFRRFGTEAYDHGHSMGLARRLSDVAGRVALFREAAYASLVGMADPANRALAPCAAEDALATSLGSKYMELAAFALDAGSPGKSGLSNFFALRVLASLSGCTYRDRYRKGVVTEELLRETVSRCTSLPFEVIDAGVLLDDVLALYRRIGIQLHVSGRQCEIPGLVVHLALNEILRNSIMATAFAHWKFPSVPFSIGFRSMRNGLKIRNPILREGGEKFLNSEWGGGQRAVEQLLDRFHVRWRRKIWRQGADVGTALVSIRWTKDEDHGSSQNSDRR